MKKMLTNNIALKIISLFFAAIFWLIVVNIDDPEVTRSISGIPVNVLDAKVITEKNQVYNIVSGETVAITVTGPRSQVDKMNRDDFLAEAPFSEKSNVDAVPIYVAFRNSKYEKSCVIKQKNMTMKLQVEDIVSKTYEIAIYNSGTEMAGYMVGKATVSPTTVTVTAPESVINIISKVQVNVDVSKNAESFSEDVTIRYYTETGSAVNLGEHASVTNDMANVSVQMYSIKEVPLKFGSTGTVADGYELVEIAGNKQTVKIAGTNVNQVESIVFPDELINISGATKDVVVDVDVAAQLPSGVSLVDEKNDATVIATAKIEKLIWKNYSLPISEIDMNNLPEGLEAKFEEQNVNVRLSGLQTAHDSFNMGDLNAYVDLRNVIEGRNEVIVKMTIPDGLKLSADVRANVLISKEQSETTTLDETTPKATTPPETTPKATTPPETTTTNRTSDDESLNDEE